MVNLEGLLTPREAAKRLGIHEESIRRLLRSGNLHGEKIGNQWFIPRTELDRFAGGYDPKTGKLRRLL